MQSPRRLLLLSGGSAGLGRALCLHYASQGHQVLEFSRSAPHAFSVRADFSEPLAAVPVIDAALAPLASQEWDELRVIGNAASLHPMGAVADQDPAAVLANLQTNFGSAILFFSRALRAFGQVPARKQLVSVSSGAAVRGVAGWSLYCAAKAGLDNFVRAVAAEQAHAAHPWLALNVDPGVMDTAMQSAIRASHPQDFPDVARYLARHQAGELRPPGQIALAIARLLEAPGLEPGSRQVAADWL